MAKYIKTISLNRLATLPFGKWTTAVNCAEEWQCSRSVAASTLDNLADLGYVERREEPFGKRTHTYYRRVLNPSVVANHLERIEAEIADLWRLINTEEK